MKIFKSGKYYTQNYEKVKCPYMDIIPTKYTEKMKIKEESLKEFRFVNCDLNVGDAVLFKLNLVHKTGPNTSS